MPFNDFIAPVRAKREHPLLAKAGEFTTHYPLTINYKMKSALFNRKPDDKPYLISGPCSAETEEQVLETCQRLAATGKVQALRAGIWNPRTKPGMFEGVGTKGLPWLK